MHNQDSHSANTSQRLTPDHLVPSSFTQKSQSLRQQMEQMHDKLFETDKLIQMQALLRLNFHQMAEEQNQNLARTNNSLGRQTGLEAFHLEPTDRD